jgi:hypothetical protein
MRRDRPILLGGSAGLPSAGSTPHRSVPFVYRGTIRLTLSVLHDLLAVQTSSSDLTSQTLMTFVIFRMPLFSMNLEQLKIGVFNLFEFPWINKNYTTILILSITLVNTTLFVSAKNIFKLLFIFFL